jgi:hypothetical protein
LDPGAKQSGSRKHRSYTKGWWRYLTVPDSHSVRLCALLVPVCPVDLRPNSSNMPSGSFAAIILETHSGPFLPSTRLHRPSHHRGPLFTQAAFSIENP